MLLCHLYMKWYDCRSRVRLYKSFDGVGFWSWVSSAKSWWFTEWLVMISESGVVYKTNSTGPSTEPCGTPNMRGEEEEAELLITTHWFLSGRYDQNHWRAVERMPKTVSRRKRRIWWSIVSNAAERSSKSRTEILSSSITFSKSFTTRFICCVRCGRLTGKDCRSCFLRGVQKQFL